MTSLLIALLGVLLVPLFVATWRTSLFGLACQGWLMVWIAFRLGADVRSADGLVTLLDLGLVRGVAAPLLLRRVLLANKVPVRNDVIPPNLLSWTFALGTVLIGFNFAAARMPGGGEQRTLVAVATSGGLLGFLVLATQTGPFSQIVGALRFENAIALFELGGARHRWPLGVEIGQSVAVLLTVLLYCWYLSRLGAPHASTLEDAEGPTL